MILKRIFLYVILYSQISPVFAIEVTNAQFEKPTRPRVGLVLGGGGARGAAHIGVLQVLEELRIPVDAVGGTSVGAIIGGLYAAGLSPDEIEEAIVSIDWPAIFSDDLKRPQYSFRRKEDDFSLLIDFEIGFRGGRVRLPKGLVQGQKIMQFLREQTLSVFNIQDFDKLPTPFRAIATDLKTGQAVALKQGDLAMAIQASMAVPGVFAPVEIDDYLLVDGGLVSNLPVQAVQDMDVDILIVVDIGQPLRATAPILSALDVTDRMMTIFVGHGSEQEKSLLVDSHILLKPKMGSIGSGEFTRVAEAVPLGRAAVRESASRLTSLSVDPESYQQYLLSRWSQRRLTSPSIDFVQVHSDSVVSPKYIEAVVKTRAAQTLDPELFAQDVNRIYGLGLFERVDAEVVQHQEQTGIRFTAKRKTWGPHYLRFGMNLVNDFEGGSDFNLSVRYTRTELNSRAAEWRNDIQVGVFSGLLSEFYQPLSRGSPFFLAPRIEIETNRLNEFENGERIAEFRRAERSFGVDGGRELGNWGEVRLGLRKGDGDLSLRTGDPSNPIFADSDFNIGRYFLRFAYDTLDNVRFPRQGQRFSIQSEFSQPELGADNEFELHQLEWLGAKTFKRHTLATRWLLGSTPGQGGEGLEESFQLGGFLNLSGLRKDELSGRYQGFGSVIYYRNFQFANEALASQALYIGGSLELGNVWQSRNDVGFGNALSAGSLFVGMDTFLGPVYLAAGRTENADTAFYFFLGQRF